MERKSRRLDGPPRYLQCTYAQEQTPDKASPIFPFLLRTKTSLFKDIQKRETRETLMANNQPSEEIQQATSELRQTDREIAKKEERMRWLEVLSRRRDIPKETVQKFITDVKKEEKKLHEPIEPQSSPADPLETLVFKKTDEETELRARESELDILFHYREEELAAASAEYAEMISRINENLGYEFAQHIMEKVSALTKALVDREEIRTEKLFKNALTSSTVDEESARIVWDNYRERTAIAFDE